ncbi:MAG: ATP-binding protein [Polyangiaceae bacterium]
MEVSLGFLFGAPLVSAVLGAVVARHWAQKRLAKTDAVLAEKQAENARLSAAAHRREVLIKTLVDEAPMAMVVYTNDGRIIYTNEVASKIFFEGKHLAGGDFLALLSQAPAALRRAVMGSSEEIFSVDDSDGERHLYLLSKSYLTFESDPVTVLVVKPIQRELARNEVDAWKKLIRVLGHELNNSLAPISSMVHSAMVLSKNGASEKLERVLASIAERTVRLGSFLESYARLARLPAPRCEDVSWDGFLTSLKELWPGLSVSFSGGSSHGYFDAAQLQQVLINLIKNAEESGSPRDGISLAIDGTAGGGCRIVVSDRGQGMSAEVMENALVPFYSTKERGSGLGLPLCREIVEAHGGRLRLRNRSDGGLEVSLRLPGRSNELSATLLTMTRG